MKTVNKTLAIATLTCAPLAVVPLTASALDVSANVTMATDYVFRGFSQTNEKGAIQGGFDVGFENGLYVGTWASNVDFGDNTSTEMDFYVGYGFDVNDDVSLDFSAIHFNYAGEESALNYQEYVASVMFQDFSFTLVYSPNYFGDNDTDAYISSIGYSLGLTEVSSLDFHLGYSHTDTSNFFGDTSNYWDYMVGYNHDVAGVTLGLAWHGTDINSDDLADDRLVFSVSAEF